MRWSTLPNSSNHSTCDLCFTLCIVIVVISRRRYAISTCGGNSFGKGDTPSVTKIRADGLVLSIGRNDRSSRMASSSTQFHRRLRIIKTDTRLILSTFGGYNSESTWMKLTWLFARGAINALPRDRKVSESHRISNDRSGICGASITDAKPYLPPISTTLESLENAPRVNHSKSREFAGSRATNGRLST